MVYREIPEGSVEVQTGLYWHRYSKVILGTLHWFGELYSSEGYVFYDRNQPENYDDEDNLLPANELVYATFMTCVYNTTDEINANIISVPYEEGYECVSVSTPEVTE